MRTLADYCLVTMGQAPSGESYNDRKEGLPLIAGAGDFKGQGLAPTKFTTAAGKISKADDIVLSIRASIGAKVWADGEYCLGRGVAGLRPGPHLDRRYLWHWLSRYEGELAAKGRGATFLQISKADIEQMPLDPPPLAEQRRIAAILDHADAIRAKRRQVLAHLDTLTDSIFFEMFGDLRSSRWPCEPFSRVVSRVDNGTSPNCESRPAGAGEWAVLKLGAVTYGQFRPEENKAYLGELGKMTENEVRLGDVLMTRKNTRELVGAVALVDQARPRLLIPDLVFRLHLDPTRIDPRYFQALMMNPQKRPAVRDLSSGSASSMPNISKSRLAGLPLELPPLALQKEFAARVERVGGYRTRMSSVNAVESELFASLQSRAFSGRL